MARKKRITPKRKAAGSDRPRRSSFRSPTSPTAASNSAKKTKAYRRRPASKGGDSSGTRVEGPKTPSANVEQVTMIVNRDGTTRSLSRDESCLRKLEPLGIVNAGEYRNCYLRKTEDLAPEAASAALRHIQTSGGESKFSSAPTELPPGKWWVDLMPVGGAVLGPFDTRKEAEAANDEFQVENDLPEAIHVRSPEERNLYLKQIEAKGGQVFEQARQLMEDYHQLHLRFDHPQVNDGWDGHTRARNKWIYEQVMAGVAHKETIRELNEKPKEWDRISNGTGVRKAALAYAEKYGLPKPAPRK